MEAVSVIPSLLESLLCTRFFKSRTKIIMAKVQRNTKHTMDMTRRYGCCAYYNQSCLSTSTGEPLDVVLGATGPNFLKLGHPEDIPGDTKKKYK